MIVSVEKVREVVDTELSDVQLSAKLTALEQFVRRFTNNSFQKREISSFSEIVDDKILNPPEHVSVGDTIQITQSLFNNGVYLVTAVSQNGLSVSGELIDCAENFVSKVCYPPDVVEGVIKLLKWDIDYSSKIGIQSEKLSRHSVTYFNYDENSLQGFPKSLVGFLKPYVKARF